MVRHQEYMTNQLELFNAHQEDVRRRADSLCKAIFVLAGGTLTVSIGIFTRESAPELPQSLSCVLMASWWALIAAIIFLVLALSVIILRDYALGERWRKKIAGQNIDASGSPTIVEILILVLGVLGLLAFIGGILGQTYVASSLL